MDPSYLLPKDWQSCEDVKYNPILTKKFKKRAIMWTNEEPTLISMQPCPHDKFTMKKITQGQYAGMIQAEKMRYQSVSSKIAIHLTEDICILAYED